MGKHGKEELQTRTSYNSLVEKGWGLGRGIALDGKKGTNPRLCRGKINLTA